MASKKKGYPVQWRKSESIFMNALLKSNCAWTYNWNVSMEDDLIKILHDNDINYCPCVWGRQFDIKKESVLIDKPKFILGYNEPDNKMQANMSIDMVLSKWHELSENIDEDIILVGPSMSDGVFKYRKELYDAFYSNGLRFDAIGLHYYRTDINAFPRNDIPYLSDKYSKPCVITEYGYMDWKNPERLKYLSTDEKINITSQVIGITNFFEDSHDVFGYCIYPSYSVTSYHGDKYNSFNMLEGNKLTQLYLEYANI